MREGKTLDLDNDTYNSLESFRAHEKFPQLYERVIPAIIEEDIF